MCCPTGQPRASGWSRLIFPWVCTLPAKIPLQWAFLLRFPPWTLKHAEKNNDFNYLSQRILIAYLQINAGETIKIGAFLFQIIKLLVVTQLKSLPFLKITCSSLDWLPSLPSWPKSFEPQLYSSPLWRIQLTCAIEGTWPAHGTPI